MHDKPTPDPAPPAQEAPDAASAASSTDLGASAPLDNVVSFDAAAQRRASEDSSSSSSAGAGTAASAPPPPQKSATAREKGEGAKDGKAGKKTEKTIDWGKFAELLRDFVLIYGTDTVWDGKERMIMKIANMGHAHGSDMVRLWKGSADRRTVRQTDVVFDPTMKADPDRCVNLFDGLAMEPTEGDVAPMLELIRFLTSRASEHDQECDEIMHWLLCWLAYPLQHPGAKMRTSVIMHGDEGAGKNFLFDTVVSIYGKYGALVGQDELEDKFNDWRSCKLFVVGDEVSSRAELVHNKNRLKALITSPTVQINPKNLPRREESNHINIVFLSNELQPLALDNSDRRYLVIYTPRAKDVAFYRKLGAWRDSGGAEAFYHYLLHYPLEGFEPFAPAPLTEAKTALIALNRKSPEQFWHEWANGELDLPYNTCSLPQAYRAYLRWCTRVGERFPFKREQFTPTVERFSEAQGRKARCKVMKIDTGTAKKAERMLLVTEPPAEAQGAWASDAVRLFEDYLKEFLGWTAPAPKGSAAGQGEGD
jgi:hypothetical protein